MSVPPEQEEAATQADAPPPAGVPMAAPIGAAPIGAARLASTGGSISPTVPRMSMPLRAPMGRGFCSGESTAMYMQGFVSVLAGDRWQQPCAVFLFQSWVLDTPAKFFLGLVGAAGAGFLTEAASAWRRAVESQGLPPWPVQILLHALILALGYADMLLIMVYNVELAVAVVLGLCVGRVLFTQLAAAQQRQYFDPPGFPAGKRPLIQMTPHGATPCCVAE